MPFLPSASLFGRLSNSIEERLSKTVGLLLPKADGFWRNNFTQGVAQVPMGTLGRDWEHIMTWQGALTGVVEAGRPRGDFPLAGDDATAFGAKMFTQSVSEVWPSGLDGANMQDFYLGIPIRSMLGNIAFTLGEKTAQSNPGSIVKDIQARKLLAFARHWTHAISLFLYLSQNDNYQYATVGAVTAPVASGSLFTFTFQPTTNVVARFFTGLRIDIYESTGTTRQNVVGAVRSEVKVAYADRLTNTVQCITNVDPTTWTGGIPVNGDIVVPVNSRATTAPLFTGIAGLNSYIKSGSTASENSRYILGGERDTAREIDLSVHPDFKSFTKAHGGGPMTHSVLSQYVHAFNDAYENQGVMIDWVVSGRGVWHNYWEQYTGLQRLTRAEFQSLPKESSPGENDFEISVDGHTIRGYTSNKINDGEMYGGQKNWQIVTPPDFPGLKNLENTETKFVPVKFVAPALTGTESIYLPIYDSSATGNLSQVTEAYQAPCWVRMNIAPKHPAGIKITGIDSSYVYSDN